MNSQVCECARSAKRHIDRPLAHAHACWSVFTFCHWHMHAHAGPCSLFPKTLLETPGQPHVHHPTTGQPFNPDVHKRHPWDLKRVPPRRMPWDPKFWQSQMAGYSEVDELGEKHDVPRTGHAEAAHKHFTSALRKINMLDQQRVFHARVNYHAENRQLDVESLDSAEQARNREVALGFNRYLLHRFRGAVVKKGASAADSKFSNALGLKQSRRTIRAGTFNLLARTIPPWNSELEFVRNWMSIFFLVYTLFFQVCVTHAYTSISVYVHTQHAHLLRICTCIPAHSHLLIYT